MDSTLIDRVRSKQYWRKGVTKLSLYSCFIGIHKNKTAWHKIISCKIRVEYTVIQVRPATDPTSPNENTAHFFTSKATSNFLLLREGTEVTAAVLGRNEVTNTHEDNSFFDKMRNLIVSTGAKIGMADAQWKNLIGGILGK